MEDRNTNDLIKKYIEDTATPAEKDELMHWYHSQVTETIESPYQNEQEEAGAQKKMLGNLLATIHTVKQVNNRRKYIWYNIAAAILVLITIAGFFKWRSAGTTNNNLAANIITTRRGEHKKVTLSDGSVIWLSAESSISYPSAFSVTTREISFEGEAFFDIAKDKAHPFIIHSGKTSVKVLGTTFNINSYKDHQTTVVSLITGKVAFSDGKIQQQLLPGYKITYSKTAGEAKVERIANTESITARREGRYEYKNVRVEDVIEDINRNFDTRIKVEGAVKNCLFYGRMNADESPEQFVKKLAKIMNATVLKTNNTYIIKGGGCI